MMRTYGIEREFIPCWSVVLRLWVRPQAMALQYLLPALGCGWALIYFWKRRHAWDWVSDGSVLVLVSVLSAPYYWLFDQAIVIPALLHAAYVTRSRTVLALLALGSIAVETGMVLGYQLPSKFYLWTAPAWLAWYLLAMATARQPGSLEAATQ